MKKKIENFSEEAISLVKLLLEKRKDRIIRNIANCDYNDTNTLIGLKAELRVVMLLLQDLELELSEKRFELEKELENILSHEGQ